jgi:hypothetical protein
MNYFRIFREAAVEKFKVQLNSGICFSQLFLNFSGVVAAILFLLAVTFPNQSLFSVGFEEALSMSLGVFFLVGVWVTKELKFFWEDLLVVGFLATTALVIAFTADSLFDVLLTLIPAKLAAVYFFGRQMFFLVNLRVLHYMFGLLFLLNVGLFVKQLLLGTTGYYSFSLMSMRYPLQQCYVTVFFLWISIVTLNHGFKLKGGFNFGVFPVAFYAMMLLAVGSKTGAMFFLCFLFWCFTKSFNDKQMMHIFAVTIAMGVGLMVFKQSPSHYPIGSPPAKVVVKDQKSVSEERSVEQLERYKPQAFYSQFLYRYYDRKDKKCSLMGVGKLNYDSEILLRYCKGGMAFVVMSLLMVIVIAVALKTPLIFLFGLLVSLSVHEVLFVSYTAPVIAFLSGFLLYKKRFHSEFSGKKLDHDR